jgi:hypothetical protein
MLSALMMLRRVLPALRHAFREEEFGPIFGAGLLLVDDEWLKVCTVLYQLVGIGIVVEVLRRLGIAFITVRAQANSASRSGGAPESA